MKPCTVPFWILPLFVLISVSACGDGNPRIVHTETATSTSTGTGTGTGTDTGDAGLSDLSNADAQTLFNYPHVPTFDISLPDADWQALKANARDEQYVPAQVTFEGHAVGTVGLRFKGSYGSLFDCFDDQGNMTCPRLSMKMKFDEYEDNQRFYGLKRLAFNAYMYDDSRMKEKLSYDLYRAMGIVAPRSSWAVLRVNGELLGLFGMVEVVDGRFTKDRWPNHPDGNLYKELWPTHATAVQIAAALETNEELADISAYAAFSNAIMAAEENSVLPTLGHYMDLDYVARYMAVDDALVSYDSVTYFWTDGVSTNNHNYFVYEESPTRFTLIPWDAESTFWINPDHTAPHWTVVPADCSLTYEYWGGRAFAPGCDRVFRALDTDLSAWRAAARALLDGPFAESTMIANINQHAAFIGDAARSDPTPTKYSTFDQAVQNLRWMIPQQRARLEQLISK
jgi:spore coat protein CotH